MDVALIALASVAVIVLLIWVSGGFNQPKPPARGSSRPGGTNRSATRKARP